MDSDSSDQKTNSKNNEKREGEADLPSLGRHSPRRAGARSEKKKAMRWRRYGGNGRRAKIEQICALTRLKELTKDNVPKDVAQLIRENKPNVWKLNTKHAYPRGHLTEVSAKLRASNGRYAVVACRISGTRLQRKGKSLTQQEAENLIAAIRAGYTDILVISETNSAKTGNPRPIFDRLVDEIRRERVAAWFTSGADRITRSFGHGGRFIEALLESGMLLFMSGHNAGGSDRDGQPLPIDPLRAVILMFEFIVANMQNHQTSAGARRVKWQRIKEGEIIQKVTLPIGIDVTTDNKPHCTPESERVLLRIIELLAANVQEKQVAETIRQEFPEWCQRYEHDREAEGDFQSRKGTPLTKKRQRRFAESTLHVDGKVVWTWGGKSTIGTYPHLAGLIPPELRLRALACMRARDKTSERRRSPWEKCMEELTVKHGYPLELISLASGRVFQHVGGRHWHIRCPKCGCSSDEGDATTEGPEEHLPVIHEGQPKYVDLELANGTRRKKYRIPVFHCNGCGETTLPFREKALRWLLAGARPVGCPFCGRFQVHLRDPAAQSGKESAEAPRWGEDYLEADCPDCRIPFPVPRRLIFRHERARLLFPPHKGGRNPAEDSTDGHSGVPE